jgi:antitoxin component YwqK of YwqJK toxin-antitoxin module
VELKMQFKFQNDAEWRKKSEENHKDRQLEGLQASWHDNGQKKFEGNYVNGQKEGLGTGWYNNEQKNYEVNYANGKKEGLQVE